jgi:hypothetical protein
MVYIAKTNIHIFHCLFHCKLTYIFSNFQTVDDQRYLPIPTQDFLAWSNTSTHKDKSTPCKGGKVTLKCFISHFFHSLLIFCRPYWSQNTKIQEMSIFFGFYYDFYFYLKWAPCAKICMVSELSLMVLSINNNNNNKMVLGAPH